MNNLDDRKPTRMPGRGVINSGSLAYKYLLNYDKELLEKPKPIDIIDFISNYLHLSVINATMSHPIVEAFIIYSIGNFKDQDADLELFADGTANAITMPATTFLPLASKLMEEYGFSDNRIIEASKKNETAEIIRKLATTYNVPEFAVKNHLYNFGMFMINENDIL